MKFTAATTAFSDVMTTISRIIENRNTYPILANVVVECRDDYLRLRATDLDIELTMSVPAEVSKPGIITVPGKMLAEILRKMKGVDKVTFSLEDGGASATLAGGRSRFQLGTLSEDGFPTLKSSSFTGRFDIAGKDLAGAFSRVAFAISGEETRYYLNGICMDPKDEQMTFVATDGHRMARLTRDLHVEGTMARIIVPKKTVGEIQSLADKAGDAILHFEISDNKIQMTTGTTTLLSKLIEGTFPDYDRVTPKNNNIIAMMESKVAIAATDRVSTIASERGGKAVKINLTQGLMTMTVMNQDHGEATDEVPVDYDADPFEIGFNARYLIDAMSVFGAATIRMAVSDPGAPAVLTSESQPGLMVVCMPMRV